MTGRCVLAWIHITVVALCMLRVMWSTNECVCACVHVFNTYACAVKQIISHFLRAIATYMQCTCLSLCNSNNKTTHVTTSSIMYTLSHQSAVLLHCSMLYNYAIVICTVINTHAVVSRIDEHTYVRHTHEEVYRRQVCYRLSSITTLRDPSHSTNNMTTSQRSLSWAVKWWDYSFS